MSRGVFFHLFHGGREDGAPPIGPSRGRGYTTHPSEISRTDQLKLQRKVAWLHPDEAKAGKAIAIPLNEDALACLRRRLGQHREYVFTYRGKPVAVRSTNAWKRALAEAGIKDFRWHDLRHSWASWHVQSGTSLQQLMQLGG